MEEQVLALLAGLRPAAGEDEGLRALVCRCALARLEGLLRDGTAPEDCGEAYPLAAAWLAADWLEQAGGGEGIVSLSAGDLSVQRSAPEPGRLSRRALELLGPWLREEGFVFRGVRG